MPSFAVDGPHHPELHEAFQGEGSGSPVVGWRMTGGAAARGASSALSLQDMDYSRIVERLLKLAVSHGAG